MFGAREVSNALTTSQDSSPAASALDSRYFTTSFTTSALAKIQVESWVSANVSY